MSVLGCEQICRKPDAQTKPRAPTLMVLLKISLHTRDVCVCVYVRVCQLCVSKAYNVVDFCAHL